MRQIGLNNLHPRNTINIARIQSEASFLELILQNLYWNQKYKLAYVYNMFKNAFHPYSLKFYILKKNILSNMLKTDIHIFKCQNHQ